MKSACFSPTAAGMYEVRGGSSVHEVDGDTDCNEELRWMHSMVVDEFSEAHLSDFMCSL